MNNELEEAQKVLSIKNVTLRNSGIILNDDVEPFELKSLDYVTQSFRGVDKVKEISIESEGKSWWEYHFFYSAGIRLVENDEGETTDEDETNIYVEITATFNALYRTEKKLDKSVVEAFSEHNVGYHVWPYWREFVQMSCSRLNIPLLETPFYICQSNKT